MEAHLDVRLANIAFVDFDAEGRTHTLGECDLGTKVHNSSEIDHWDRVFADQHVLAISLCCEQHHVTEDKDVD
jgi:hypothetical protein